MMRTILMAALLLTSAAATPATADRREKSYNDRGASAESSERARDRKVAKHDRWKQRRYAKRHYRYYYPYTSWWGPFAGPPGL